MPEVIITITKDQVTPFIKKLKGKPFQDLMGNINYRLAKNAKYNIRKQIVTKKLIWTGNLWNSVKASKLGNKQSIVEMDAYGMMLDSMPTHWVSKDRLNSQGTTSMAMWMMTREGSPWFGLKYKNLPTGVRVKAHPFINDAFMATERATNRIIKEEIKKIDMF